MATPRLGLVVEDKPTELSCRSTLLAIIPKPSYTWQTFTKFTIRMETSCELPCTMHYHA